MINEPKMSLEAYKNCQKLSEISSAKKWTKMFENGLKCFQNMVKNTQGNAELTLYRYPRQ